MNKAKSFIFISVLLLVASSALGDMLPVKVIASNRQLTVFPALVAGKYLLKTVLSPMKCSKLIILEREMICLIMSQEDVKEEPHFHGTCTAHTE